MPCSVSGVTTAPSEMPISTRRTRSSGVGISIGRPASEAAATANIEPDRKPAGIPRKPSVNPPTAATASVSARLRAVAMWLMDDGADKMARSMPCAAAPVNRPTAQFQNSRSRVNASSGRTDDSDSVNAPRCSRLNGLTATLLPGGKPARMSASCCIKMKSRKKPCARVTASRSRAPPRPSAAIADSRAEVGSLEQMITDCQHTRGGDDAE